MTKLTIKDLTFIVAMSALLAVTSTILIMPFVLVTMALTFKRKHIYYIALLTALATFLIFGNIFYLVNIFFIPFMALITRLICPLITNKEKHTSLLKGTILTLFALVLFLFTNFASSIVYGLWFSTIEAAVLDALLTNLIQAFINALLVGILSLYLQNRLAQILLEKNI
ncbi:MAG: hypothetical protein RBQ97_00075 [Acholeplasma sp.]|nr:hypothetical protein [Acholeplasma sp.]